MEQKFSNNSIDLQVLREFCEREGEAVSGWLLQVCDSRHQRRQGTYHVVFVRGRVCRRLSQLPRRASCPDHYRGDDAQPCALCHWRTDAADVLRRAKRQSRLPSEHADDGTAQCHRRTHPQTAPCLLPRPPPRHGPRALRVAATSLSWHRASPCLAGPRLFSLRHAQLPEHHPQGYHVRSAISRLCRGLFVPFSVSLPNKTDKQ